MRPVPAALAVVFAALVCAALSVTAPAPGYAKEAVPRPGRIAVLSAFEPEWTALTAMVDSGAEERHHGVRFVTGTIAGRDVVLLLSGIGMVNAAMSAQMVIDRYHVEAMIFSGIAGGIDPALSIGDVVVPARWGSYLNAVMARETAEGHAIPPFLTSPFPNYGMIFTLEESVRRDGQDGQRSQFWFEADPDLLRLVRDAAAVTSLHRCAQACLRAAPKIVIGGNGISGSAFLDNADYRRFLFATFDAAVVDMESAAVAQVAATNAVPFVALRSLSDLAGGGGSENEMATFMSLAAINSAELVRSVLAAAAAAAPIGDATDGVGAADAVPDRPRAAP